MNSDSNIAAYLSIRPKVNGQQSLTGFVKFFYYYPSMISVHMSVISVVKRCFRLGLNYLIHLKKS